MSSSEVLDVGDGLKALQAVVSIKEIAGYIEKTAKWVSPETFHFLPIWFPEHARKSHFYKGNWSEAQTNTNRETRQTVHKVEGNINANSALTMALGLKKKDRPSWSCCHIWGIDDNKYQQSNLVVMDNRFYSCVGNMVLLPTPLKAFTDTMPEIKSMLRVCASNLYGWRCDHPELANVNEQLDAFDLWNEYPESWPRKTGEAPPIGTVPFNQLIRDAALKRKAKIKHDLECAGEHYPREKVMDALKYWNVAL